jgi:hypothetical protein
VVDSRASLSGVDADFNRGILAYIINDINRAKKKCYCTLCSNLNKQSVRYCATVPFAWRRKLCPRSFLSFIFRGPSRPANPSHYVTHKKRNFGGIAQDYSTSVKVHQGGAQLVEMPAIQTKASSSSCYAETNTRGTHSNVLIST